MLSNYLIIAVRALRRHLGYTFINVSGLAVGLACALLILLFVRDELSYDRFNEHADRIVRVHIREDLIVTPTIVAPLFSRTFPEVEAAVRLYDVSRFRPVVMAYRDHQFEEHGFMYADSTVFDVFTLPFLAGTPETALTRPNTLVLTQSAARRYFGDEDPVGKTLRVGSDGSFEVTGVIADLPSTSHLSFDVLASFVSTGWASREIWSSANFLTYLLLRDPQAAASLEAKLPDLIRTVQSDGGVGNSYYLTLVPLTDIYLRFEDHLTYVTLFGAIAALILLIACINYMNLATARSAHRAREVGMRKMFGAERTQLIRQFYGESAVLVGIALALGLLLARLSLPLFNAVSGKALTFDAVLSPLGLGALILVGAFVTLVAGSYPALYLSAFRPAIVLKGTFRTRRGAVRFRQGLVVFQFAVSVFLIASTFVVHRQLRFMQSADLGFNEHHVVALPIGDRELRDGYVTLKEALLQHPNVRSAAAVNSLPGYHRGGYALEAEGLELSPGETFGIRGLPADKDVVEALGLTLLAGPGFPKSDAYTPEQGYAYLINETTVQRLGWTPEDAIGKRFNLLGNRQGTVVGVVNDFHHSSLREGIDPLAFFIDPGNYEYLLVRIAPEDAAATLAAIEQTWRRLVAHRPYEPRFVDQEIAALYRPEARIGRIFSVFTALALGVGCLGLFGLAAFAAEQRTREIGIRKVLGASVPGLMMLLTRDFTRLVFVAFVVAAPLAYLAMNRWLDAFAYRIEISWWIFLMAGLGALLVTLFSVGYQAGKAALVEPVRSLRHE